MNLDGEPRDGGEEWEDGWVVGSEVGVSALSDAISLALKKCDRNGNSGCGIV